MMIVTINDLRCGLTCVARAQTTQHNYSNTPPRLLIIIQSWFICLASCDVPKSIHNQIALTDCVLLYLYETLHITTHTWHTWLFLYIHILFPLLHCTPLSSNSPPRVSVHYTWYFYFLFLFTCFVHTPDAFPILFFLCMEKNYESITITCLLDPFHSSPVPLTAVIVGYISNRSQIPSVSYPTTLTMYRD